jgi:DNA-binding transcriptional regulator YiaG
MANTFAKFKENALKKEGVKAAYDSQTPEFVALDQFLRARTDAALTQSEVAQRMHTTQSVVARIETAIQTLAQPHGDTQQGARTYIPSLSSLQRYASAVGCRLELNLVRQ